MVHKMKELFARWRVYKEITGVAAIYRRYFVMNAFDGVLTILGVIIGAYMAGDLAPIVVIYAGIFGSLAMGISGFSGAYMAESAERKNELKEMEEAMLISMDDTLHAKAAKWAAFVTAIVDGVSPALASIFVIMPFYYAYTGAIEVSMAFTLSIIVSLIILFILGLYLGKVSKEHMLLQGIKMLAVGLILAIVSILLARILPYSVA